MSEHKYWFPAKKRGWGWGAPCCWQGWLVLCMYILAIVWGSLGIDDAGNGWVTFWFTMAVSTAFLVALCWLKGEKPCWR